ncbi:putative invertase inhibitor [Aristolochia californica]|uniref:putative invertase inhibitor n=1 Tax=Aristolochia californica TaxID=171875 RepID=UPI0035DA3CF7
MAIANKPAQFFAMTCLNPPFRPLPLVLVPFLLVFTDPSLGARLGDQNSDELVDRVCRGSDDYYFCVSTLNSDHRTPNADLVGLAQISVDVTTKDLTSTYNYIEVLLKKTTDPRMKRDLGQCSGFYDTARNATLDASKAVARKDFAEVVTDAQLVGAAVGDCQDVFRAENPPLASPLKEQNQNAIDLATIVNSAANLLRGSH